MTKILMTLTALMMFNLPLTAFGGENSSCGQITDTRQKVLTSSDSSDDTAATTTQDKKAAKGDQKTTTAQ